MSNRNDWIFLISLLLYSFGHILTRSISSWGYAIASCSAVVFLWMLFTNKSKNINSFQSNNKSRMIVGYCIVSFIITFQWSYFGIRQIFLDPYLLLPYISIIAVTKRYSYHFIPTMIKILTVSACVFFIYTITNLADVLYVNPHIASDYLSDRQLSFDVISKRLCSCSGFILLLSPLLKKRYSIVAIAAFCLNMLLSIFLGRRNIIFSNGLIIIASLFLFIKYSVRQKVLKLLLYILMIAIGLYITLNLMPFLENNNLLFFSTLSNRFNEDTRSIVSDAFYRDMNSNPIQWLFGKGIVSSYYCPNVQDGLIYRNIVETGWQQVVFKLGAIVYILMLTIQIKAIRQPKKNILTIACGVYIIISILEMAIAGVPAFDLRYVLIWVFVSICNDIKFQSLDNNQVSKLINF